MVNTMRSANSRQIVCWMSSSVSLSAAAVASWLPWLRGFVAAAVASNQDLNFKEQRAR